MIFNGGARCWATGEGCSALLHSAAPHEACSFAISGNDRNAKVYFVCGTESSVTPLPHSLSPTLENIPLNFRPATTTFALPIVVSLHVKLQSLTPCRFSSWKNRKPAGGVCTGPFVARV
jgi:hypothetical protein